MYLKNADHLEVKMNSSEAYDIACDIRRILEQTTAEHWIKWYKQENSNTTPEGFVTYLNHPHKEASRLEKIELLYGISGHPSLYDDLIYCLKQIFVNHKQVLLMGGGTNV